MSKQVYLIDVKVKNKENNNDAIYMALLMLDSIFRYILTRLGHYK